VIFRIRGKLMRTVPVILHCELLECLHIILKYRHDAKVPLKNPFLFGVSHDNKKRFKYLRACVLLRIFSEDCGAKLPCSLRGTQLRKHIATCCITLNLSEDQVTDLANFMGHDKKVHKSHYRQPIPELEIIRITQFLEAAQGNTEEKTKENNETFSDNNYSNSDSDIKNTNNDYDDESDIENEEKNILLKQRRNVKAEFPEKDVSDNNNKKRRNSKYNKFYRTTGL